MAVGIAEYLLVPYLLPQGEAQPCIRLIHDALLTPVDVLLRCLVVLPTPLVERDVSLEIGALLAIRTAENPLMVNPPAQGEAPSRPGLEDDAILA